METAMRILVTGNCGFIAQNFVRLYRDAHEIVGVDALRYASDHRAQYLCRTMLGDIANSTHLDDLFKHYGTFDAIVHMAAESHVDNSIKSPRPFMVSNFMGVFELLEKARQYGVGRFLQIGTDETYGDLMPGDPPFSNLHELKPSSPYSASKAAADLLVLSYGRTYGMDVVITRSSNCYGPYQYKEKFLPVVVLNAMNDCPIPVYGTGLNQREWTFVEDNCRGIMAALERGKPMGIYNLGSGVESSNIDMVDKVLKLMGKSQSLIKFVEDRKGHDFRYFLDSSLAENELGWHATTSLDEGLRKTVDWFIQNPNYWGDSQ
jgi:dTDP-glucose 4,6-dehydratase